MAGLVEADLSVEDGTGIATANAYVDFAFVDAYHRIRCNAAWAAASENDKVAAIVRATDYVDRRWRFLGTRSSSTQGLEWPRIGGDGAIFTFVNSFIPSGAVTDINGFDQTGKVPDAVKDATAEYALRALDAAGALDESAPLLPDPSQDEGFITLKREQVDVIEVETQFSDRIRRVVIKSYPLADRILQRSGLVVASSGRTVRA